MLKKCSNGKIKKKRVPSIIHKLSADTRAAIIMLTLILTPSVELRCARPIILKIT